MKNYNVQTNIGKAKYVVSFHDGIKKYPDQSDFYDIRIFQNKKLLRQFIDSLTTDGYVEK